MRIFIFSYWYEPVNKTSVNRVRYWKDSLIKHGFDVKIIFVNISGRFLVNNNHHSIKLPFSANFLQRVTFFFSRNPHSFFFRFFYFLHLLYTNRDIYNFFDVYRKNEHRGKINISKSDIIITTAPPYSVFNIGWYLKRRFGCKWIMDYRDPWTLGYRPVDTNWMVTTFRKLFQRKSEKNFLEGADLITTISESLKSTLPSAAQSKTHVIENGSNIREMNLSSINDHPEIFTIVYSGTIYNDQLQEQVFFQSVKTFIDQHGIAPSDFKIQFIGSAENRLLNHVIRKYKLEDYTVITDRLPLKEAFEYMYNACLFLQLRYSECKSIITSKQSDYLCLQKRILLPVSDEGDMAESIRKHDVGYVCHNEHELINVLTEEYNRFLSGGSFRVERSSEELRKLSRISQSEKLARLIRRHFWSADKFLTHQFSLN